MSWLRSAASAPLHDAPQPVFVLQQVTLAHDVGADTGEARAADTRSSDGWESRPHCAADAAERVEIIVDRRDAQLDGIEILVRQFDAGER